jgi:hypothetical protein
MRRKFALFLAAALVASGLIGCQKFFTTSLGESLARDSLPIPTNLSSSQATDLATQAKDNNDSKLASALVSSLVTQIASTTDADTKVELQSAAVTAAIVASGTSDALTGIISDYGNGTTITADTLIDLVKTIQDGASGTGVVEALSYLDPDSGLSADQAKAAGLQATDLAIAAVVVASGALPADTSPLDMTDEQLTAFQATPEVQASLRIITEAKDMVDAGSESAKLLDDILAKFQLQSS